MRSRERKGRPGGLKGSSGTSGVSSGTTLSSWAPGNVQEPSFTSPPPRSLALKRLPTILPSSTVTHMQQKCWIIKPARHRYIKQLFLVLGTRLAQFKRYCSVVKCVLDGPLDTHIWPFSRTLGEEILHLYWIYCFWVPFSGRISHHFPTKPSFSPIFRIARLFENFLYQSISILTWPGAFGGPILLTRTKPDMI